MKFAILDATTDAEAIAKIMADAEAEPIAPTYVHPGAAHLVPATYARGAKGWSLPAGVVREPGSRRVIVIASDGFARGRADFAQSRDEMPVDWSRGDVDAKPPTEPVKR